MNAKLVLVKLVEKIGYGIKRAYRKVFRRPYEPSLQEPQRILVICQNLIGDTLFATPVFRGLKEHYPHSRISVWVRSGAKTMLENNPHIDELLTYDAIVSDGIAVGGFRPLGAWEPRETWRFIKGLRRRHFDLAVDLTGHWSTALIAVLMGARYKVGFNRHGLGFLLDKTLSLDPKTHELTGKHLREKYLRTVGLLGIEPTSLRLELFLSEEARHAAREFLSTNGVQPGELLVSLHPWAGWELKEWGEDRFAGLADRLQEEAHARVIILGGPQDAPGCEKLVGQMHTQPIVAVGKTSLSDSAALVQASRLLIGNDSGLSHIAEALDIPTVTIFGSTNPDFCGPLGPQHQIVRRQVFCSPAGQEHHCYLRVAKGERCSHHSCMRFISVDEVLEAAMKVLPARVPSKVNI